jgi:hypothetical protein
VLGFATLIGFSKLTIAATEPQTTVSDSQEQQSRSGESSRDEKSSVADTSQRFLSRNLLDISRAIDMFFAGDRVMEESYGSYGCVRASIFYQEAGEVDTSGDVCLKVDLPNTKKRWKLVIISDKDDEDESVFDPGSETVPSVAAEESGTLAGFRYVAREEILRHTNFDIGIKSGTPVDPFVRARFRRVWVPEPWLFRLTESVYWFKSRHTGVLSRLDVERAFVHEFYVRLTTEADFRDAEDQFHLRQTFGVYRRVGKGRALNLEWQIYGTTNNPETRVEYYVYRARYRVNLWRDWFFVEVSPQLLYQRENDFKGDAGILFATEAVFGNY